MLLKSEKISADTDIPGTISAEGDSKDLEIVYLKVVQGLQSKSCLLEEHCTLLREKILKMEAVENNGKVDIKVQTKKTEEVQKLLPTYRKLRTNHPQMHLCYR